MTAALITLWLLLSFAAAPLLGRHLARRMTRLALTAASLAVILAGLVAVPHVALVGGAS